MRDVNDNNPLDNVVAIFNDGMNYAARKISEGEDPQRLLAVQDVMRQIPFGFFYAEGMCMVLKKSYEVV